MARTIAFCNQKGGVGKTTTAINLAAYLASSGKKMLLFDADPQGNATSGIGLQEDKRPSVTTYEVILGAVHAKEAIFPTSIANLDIIGSSIQLTGAEVELVGTIGREYKLQKTIKEIKDDYDFIFIDCPPSLGLLTINALTAADAVVIPIQCEYYALEGLSQLVNTINLVRDNLNPHLVIEGAVMTMADFRTRLAKEVIDEVKKFFKEKVYTSVIPRSVKLSEAPGFGKPILLYDKHSIGAKMYERLSREFLGEKIVEIQNILSHEETIITDNAKG
jgi:chromosome partitioning protein